MNEKWLIALLPIVAGLLAVPAKAENVTVNATVQPYVSVVFSYNTINFGSVIPGRTYPAPGQDLGIYNVTVDTNVNVNVSASKTPWFPSDVLLLRFITTTSLPFPPPDYNAFILTTQPQVVATLSPGYFTHYHGYWLDVAHAAAAPGTYTTTVTITYSVA